jgi:hypothetical protein
MNELGKNTIDLIFSVYKYFTSESKWESFEKICRTKPLRFKKHCEIRWCTIGPAAKRIINNLNNLQLFFSNLQKHIKPEKFSNTEKKIIKILYNGTIEAELNFIVQAIGPCENLLIFLQTNDLIIFDIHSKFKEFLKNLLVKFYKSTEILQSIDDSKCDIKNILPPSEIFMHETLIFHTKKLKEEEIREFQLNMINFYKVMVNYLYQKKLLLEFHKNCHYFNIENFCSKDSESYLASLSETVKFEINK